MRAQAMPGCPLRIAVLASGRGSNLAALIAACNEGTLPVEIGLVASDRDDANALTLAHAAGISTASLAPRDYASRRAFDLAMFERIAASGADLLVLAGFMRILDSEVLQPWIGRMVNIHPSLLPKYPGLHTHRRAIAAGDTEHGASVHYVTAELDGGPVIAQARLAVHENDDESSLADRLLPLEHRLLPAVVAAICAGRLNLHGTTVHYDGKARHLPLLLGEDWSLH